MGLPFGAKVTSRAQQGSVVHEASGATTVRRLLRVQGVVREHELADAGKARRVGDASDPIDGACRIII